MKPLTEDTLVKAAIMEGYCWEAAEAETANRNKVGAVFFLKLADCLFRLCEKADECAADDIPPPPEMKARLNR